MREFSRGCAPTYANQNKNKNQGVDASGKRAPSALTASDCVAAAAFWKRHMDSGLIAQVQRAVGVGGTDARLSASSLLFTLTLRTFVVVFVGVFFSVVVLCLPRGNELALYIPLTYSLSCVVCEGTSCTLT